MSVTKGNGNIKHNLRTQNKKPKNVDFSRTHLNLVLENINIKEAYHELFDNSVNEYNQKQRRTDRKIDDYYSKIIHDKKTKPFHELVIQVGNIDSNIDINVTNKIYTEFVEKFIQNNPQMKVIGAYVHNDEATAHLHLDYIPFASYSRGMSLRVANDRAIEQMGYRNWTDWKDRQFETLEKICHEHNIERVNMNNHSRHISVESYKKEQRMIESLQNDLEHTLKSQDLPVVEPIKPRVNRITKKKTVPYDEYLALLEHNREQSDKINTLEKQIALQKAQICSLTDEKEKYKQIYLNTRKKSYIEENEALRENLKKNWSHIHDLEVQNSKMRNLEAENISLKQELNNIKKEHTFMHTFLEQTGLLDVYESYKRMRADKKPLEILMSICESAKESIQKQIEKLEMYLKPTSIKDRLRMAKQTQTERTYEIKIYNTERMEEGSIKVSDKDLAKKLMSVMIDDSEERIAIVDTEANRKLYREMQMDQEKDIDFEMEL